VLLHRAFARGLDIPIELGAGGLENANRRRADLRPYPVTRKERDGVPGQAEWGGSLYFLK
jgi:hypothetical protein